MDTIIIFFIIIINLFALYIGTKFMKNLPKNIKTLVVLGSTLILFLLTTIIFNMASKKVSEAIVVSTSKWYMIGTMLSVNILIVVPYLAMQLSKLKEEIIDGKILRNRIIALLFIFTIFLGFEYKYIIKSQERIIDIKQELNKQIENKGD